LVGVDIARDLGRIFTVTRGVALVSLLLPALPSLGEGLSLLLLAAAGVVMKGGSLSLKMSSQYLIRYSVTTA
jgi:hypothetical protein